MLRKCFSRIVACVFTMFMVFNSGAAEKIRLLFVFDKGAMDYISQAGADYDDFAASCVTRMNTVLTNSRLNGYFTYELAGTTLLPGVDNANPATGYAEGWAALCGNRGDEWAGMLQDRYNNAADVVVLLVNTGTYAGLTGNSHPYTGSGAEYAINYAGDAFSVCSIMTAAREIQGVANAHQVLSHEVAHTLGCGHSDTQDSQQGPQSTTYAAALQFRLPDGKETMLPRTASITRDIMAYFGTTLMGYPTHIFYKDDGQGGREFMTRDEVKEMMGWTDDLENDVYYDNTDGSYGPGYQSCVWTYCYIVPYFSSPNLYFSTVTVPYGMELTDGVVTVYDQAQYDAMSAEDKAKLVPMGDATHNNRQVLIDNYQYASKWHLGVKFSKEGNASIVNGKSDKITLTPLSKDLTIYYTTDGTEPTKENGTLYTEPFSLTQAATVKARSYDANNNAGDVLSKTYTMLPLATALGNTELTWTTGPSYSWYVDDYAVARSCKFASSASGVSSVLSTTVTGPTTLSFEYQIYSAEWHMFGDFADSFTVRLDDNDILFSVEKSVTSWTELKDIEIPEGEHTLVFTYLINEYWGDAHALIRNVALSNSGGTEQPDEPESPAVESPEPVAVWYEDFSAEQAGYTLELNGNSLSSDKSTITIDQSVGVVVTNNTGMFAGGFTVLFKYSNLNLSLAARQVLAATKLTDSNNRTGAEINTAGKACGIWDGNSWNNSGTYNTMTSDQTSGVLVYTHYSTSSSAGGVGTQLYHLRDGSLVTIMNASTLGSSNDVSKYKGFSVGGPVSAIAGANAATDMQITGIAVFEGVLAEGAIKAYVWPKIETPEYEGADPIAVWVTGEFDDDKSAHGGLEFALNGNTIDENGNIVIGNSSGLGAEIVIPAGYSNASVLVRYSIPTSAHDNDSVLASMFSAYDLGVLSDSGESTGKGYWFNGSAVSDSNYAFNSPAPSIPQEGYLLLSYKHDSATAAYLGSTISTLVGGSNGDLHFSNNEVTKMAFGGPTVAGAKPWAGMVIKSVAVFLDEYLSAADIANYKFPTPSPKAVAVWNGDFSDSALTAFSPAYTLVDKQQAHGKNRSSVIIDHDKEGLFVDFDERHSRFTVLVKYSTLVKSDIYQRVLFATTQTAEHKHNKVGVWLTKDGELIGFENISGGSVYNYDQATSDGPTGSQAFSDEGTMAFIYDMSGEGGLFVYATSSDGVFPKKVAWEAPGLTYGYMTGCAVGGMCRDAIVDGVEAAKGMTITGLAVFTNALTVAEMNAYKWPEPPAYTDTEFPVPYSWFSYYYPGIEDYPDQLETMAKSKGGNGYKYWENYVLGLEPTNETSKFTVSIRMDGTTPIVEYSPTNEVLKANGDIEYVLQGKPLLINDWQDVEFEDPGDTNRFFRVKVAW